MRASARVYDLFMWPLERMGLAAARRRLHRGLKGLTLEVGAGTGLNAPARGGARAVLTDVNLGYLRRARARDGAAMLVCADAHALPFRAGSFATAVETLTFCSIPAPQRALAELRRVLRPDGELRMLDHVRAPSPWLARIQDWLTPPWLLITGDCRLNRDLLPLLAAAGFRIAQRRTRAHGIVEEISARPA